VLDLVTTEVSVVGAFASPPALDALAPAGAYRCRVAPDEVMLVREPGVGAALVRDAIAVTAGDPDAVVIDTTDGWAVWTLEGDARTEAFARLSDVRLGEHGYVQGDVAHIAVRVIVEPGRLHLFVPVMWRGYLRRRIFERCSTLEVTERAISAAWGSIGEPA
jgi:hypothetical protein